MYGKDGSRWDGGFKACGAVIVAGSWVCDMATKCCLASEAGTHAWGGHAPATNGGHAHVMLRSNGLPRSLGVHCKDGSMDGTGVLAMHGAVIVTYSGGL